MCPVCCVRCVIFFFSFLHSAFSIYCKIGVFFSLVTHLSYKDAIPIMAVFYIFFLFFFGFVFDFVFYIFISTLSSLPRSLFLFNFIFPEWRIFFFFLLLLALYVVYFGFFRLLLWRGETTQTVSKQNFFLYHHHLGVK